MQQQAQKFYQARKGFTLTELAIVMGVVGIILGGVWIAAGQVSNAWKMNKAVQELATIVTNIRSTYGDLNQFSATTPANNVTAAMINANIFPSEMGGTVTNGNVTVYPSNPWGGSVLILMPPNYIPNFAPGIGSPNHDQFTVIFNSTNPGGTSYDHILPCQQLLAMTTGSNKDNGLIAVYDTGESWQAASTATPSSFSNCSGQLGWAFTLHGSSKY